MSPLLFLIRRIRFITNSNQVLSLASELQKNGQVVFELKSSLTSPKNITGICYKEAKFSINVVGINGPTTTEVAR